jgi:hypothetical protein
MERRRLATEVEATAALHALEIEPRRAPADAWPAFDDLDSPGMYSWWVDYDGARDLSVGLGHPVEVGRIYAGQTGATKWPSGATPSTTLRGRIGGNHLRGGVRASTFRLTLAAALRDPLRLHPTGPRRLGSESEDMLSDWIREHLDVAVHAFADRDVLKDLEHRVLIELDPPLNLEGMQVTPLRVTLSLLRTTLATHASPAIETAPARIAPTTSRRTKRSPVDWSLK